jgi:hypothetical protein
MNGLIFVCVMCLLAVSTDVVDWLADKVEGMFKDK